MTSANWQLSIVKYLTISMRYRCHPGGSAEDSVCSVSTERIHQAQCIAARAKKKVLKKSKTGKSLTAAKVSFQEY